MSSTHPPSFGDAREAGILIAEEIRAQVEIIRGYLDQLDRGWIKSETVRSFLRRHYR